jgi:DNA-binding transcriptional MerR regulator
MAHTVSRVAQLAGVSVRTLHHYDDIGLLCPSSRSDAGYRLYEHRDLERLQEVRFLRELGFALDEIKGALDDPAHDRLASLRTQRALVNGKIAHLGRIVVSIDAAINAQEKRMPMNDEEMFEVFGDFDPRKHESEVEERWSGELLDESQRRTSSYTKDQWKAAMAEGEAVTNDFAVAKRAGEPANGETVMAIAERHRLQIDRWFYPCSYEIQTGLADLYVSDARFTATYEQVEPGLAAYIHDAIKANAVSGDA